MSKRTRLRAAYFSSNNHGLLVQLVITTAILLTVGTVLVFNASASRSFQLAGHPFLFAQDHIIKMIFGLVAATVVFFLKPSWWEKLGPIGFWTSVMLLGVTLIPGLGVELNGAQRWLNLGGWLFQPVEVMKLTMCIYFAHWITSNWQLKSWLLLTSIPISLVLAQPDLGSVLVLGAIAWSILLISTQKVITPAIVAIGSLVLISIMIMVSPYRTERVLTYLDPQRDPLGASFHTSQLTTTLNAGGWFGQGLGSSIQSGSSLPEPSTDSIWAVAGKEFGLVGSSLLFVTIVLWLLTIWKLHFVISGAGSLFALAVFSWLASQTIINLGAVVGLLPLSGIPLPLLSYGGTSIATILIALGILLRLSWSDYR